jgi:hypothetical protein
MWQERIKAELSEYLHGRILEVIAVIMNCHGRSAE